MQARWLFLFAVSSAVILFLASYATRQPKCLDPSPGWVDGLLYVLGPLSIVAICVAVTIYFVTGGLNRVISVVYGIFIAAAWGAAGLYALTLIVLPAGCLS